jgi:hypothetical protein
MNSLRETIERLEEELNMTDSERVKETGRRMAHLMD